MRRGRGQDVDVCGLGVWTRHRRTVANVLGEVLLGQAAADLDEEPSRSRIALLEARARLLQLRGRKVVEHHDCAVSAAQNPRRTVSARLNRLDGLGFGLALDVDAQREAAHGSRGLDGGGDRALGPDTARVNLDAADRRTDCLCGIGHVAFDTVCGVHGCGFDSGKMRVDLHVCCGDDGVVGCTFDI